MVNKVGEEDFDIFYQPTDTNQVFALTVKASGTIDKVKAKIHRLVSVHFEGSDSDLIEDRFKQGVLNNNSLNIENVEIF